MSHNVIKDRLQYIYIRTYFCLFRYVSACSDIAQILNSLALFVYYPYFKQRDNQISIFDKYGYKIRFGSNYFITYSTIGCDNCLLIKINKLDKLRMQMQAEAIHS